MVPLDGLRDRSVQKGSNHFIYHQRQLLLGRDSMEKVSMSHEDYLEAIVMLGGSDTQSVRRCCHKAWRFEGVGSEGC